MLVFKKLGWLALWGVLLLAACKKDWDKHNALTDDGVRTNLLERIKATSNLSRFAELLTLSGLDKEIASSKTYTVFAPTNDALNGLDAATVADTARLRRFLGNHIANQRYFTTQAADSLRIAMLNGKYNNMRANRIEEATISTGDVYTQNGVLHVIDKMLPALSNGWEVLNSTDYPAAQKAFLLKLNYEGFDPATAEQIGVDPRTGEPVYKPGTGIVQRNRFWDLVYDLRNEQKQFTIFALADDALSAERNVYRQYFATSTADSTDSIANFSILKDLTIEGYLAQAALPDSITSKFGTRIAIPKANIVRAVKLSNGIMYVMSAMPAAPQKKFKSIVIEAENYNFSSHDRRNNTFFRDRVHPTTGRAYRDVLVQNHGVALFNLGYNLRDLPAMKYKAYWVAVNDFQTA
ncbi:MAG TPA: fasciclin domain-containing protein, partial [Phnomibacter sp.]|nr:fasciclin domain-containing protein [Phnomibacter sp.]